MSLNHIIKRLKQLKSAQYVFALNLFNRWPISQRSGMSTYSWPAQHYWAQTVFEKLWLCALFGLRLWIALRGAEELASHVSSKVLMGATVANGLLKKKTHSFQLFFHQLKRSLKNSSESGSICSIEVNSSPVSPGYWPSQQEPPANPYTESEWERGREEGGWSRNERERQAISEKNGHLWGRRPEMQRTKDSEEEADEGERWEKLNSEIGEGDEVGGEKNKRRVTETYRC